MSADRSRGILFLIGGDEDPDPERMRILPRMVGLAGGSAARVLLCGAPTTEPIEKQESYAPLFERIGVAAFDALPMRTREEADDPTGLDLLARASVIFFPGGDQLRISTILAGTQFERRMGARLRSGELVVGGTSAGAAAISGTIIVGGEDAGAPTLSATHMAPGLGYWPDAVIEPHFSARGRIGRLVSVLAQNPGILGIGLDGDTALEVEMDRELRVVGRGTVTILDGRRAMHDTAAEGAPGDTIALTGLTMHVLRAGWRFDLRARQPIPPASEGERGSRGRP